MSKKIVNKTLTKVEAIKLKFSLIILWIRKNIRPLLWSLFIVCLVLSFTTTIIKPSTPILGNIFGNVRDSISDTTSIPKTIISFLGTISSVFIVAGLLIAKVERILLVDIKSAATKKLLIKARLRFDSNGRLVKRDKPKVFKQKKERNVVNKIKDYSDEFVTIIKATPVQEEKLEEPKMKKKFFKKKELEEIQDIEETEVKTKKKYFKKKELTESKEDNDTVESFETIENNTVFEIVENEELVSEIKQEVETPVKTVSISKNNTNNARPSRNMRNTRGSISQGNIKTTTNVRSRARR